MANVNYEEGYFRLKRSNEDLTTYINTVINDLQQTKVHLNIENEKNNILNQRTISLEKQLCENTLKCDSYTRVIEDLKDEIEHLKSFSKAVECVAENYCEQNINAETKYRNLKRKSTVIMEKFIAEGFKDINFDDEVDSPITPTPTTSELDEIKKVYDTNLSTERSKRKILRKENKKIKKEVKEIKENIAGLQAQLEEKSRESERIYIDLDTITEAYQTLKKDRDTMLDYFTPVLKMKCENLELKRTSAMLLNTAGNDARILEFMQMMDELRNENLSKDNKIKELESQSNAVSLILEISSLTLQLEDCTQQMKSAIKERDTVKHENRILQDQRVAYGTPAPAPPAPPPPPPPPNLFSKLFRKASKTPKKVLITVVEDKKVVDMMKELEDRIKKRVQRKLSEKLPNQHSLDEPDSAKPCIPVKLRSRSEPAVIPFVETKTDLQRALEKRGIIQEE